METYTGQELDAKIHTFLNKRTQRFPELQETDTMTRLDRYDNRFINPLEKASLLWSRYIHA